MDKISNKIQIPNSKFQIPIKTKIASWLMIFFSLQWLIAGMSSLLVIGGGYFFVSNIVVFS